MTESGKLRKGEKGDLPGLYAMTGIFKQVVWGLVFTLPACNALNRGDEGSESHWLTACETDDQCEEGACHCNRCTQPCASVVDCPYPLNQCASPDEFSSESCDSPEVGLCSVFDETILESVLPLNEQVVTACDEGRQTSFSVSRRRSGQTRAIVSSEGDYYLVSSITLGEHPVRVGGDGTVLQVLPAPSELDPEVHDLLPLSDGRVVLAGTVGAARDYGNRNGWIGMVDPNWQLVWERELEMLDAYDLVELTGGDLVIAGVRVAPDGDRVVPMIARFDVAGNEEWEVSASVEGIESPYWHRTLAVVAGQPRLVTQTLQGLVLVTADEFGQLTEQVLETRLALSLSGVAAVPGERLAISSSRGPGAIVTVIEADATMVWEKSFGRTEGAASAGIAYDPTRRQIVVAGSYAGPDLGWTRTWMIATDLDGEPQWELTRLPQAAEGVDGNVTTVSADRGPELNDVAVGPDGTLLATGFTARDLSFFVVGSESCE